MCVSVTCVFKCVCVWSFCFFVNLLAFLLRCENCDFYTFSCFFYCNSSTKPSSLLRGRVIYYVMNLLLNFKYMISYHDIVENITIINEISSLTICFCLISVSSVNFRSYIIMFSSRCTTILSLNRLDALPINLWIV